MKRPSTRSLSDLPSINELLRQAQSLAMLDAILSPEWEYRYYSFNSKWAPGEMMASMRDGSGDDLYILFAPHGTAIKGFDHEAPMSPWNADPPVVWPGMYDSLPSEFSAFLKEPAFAIQDVTFCLWRRPDEAVWNCGVTDFPDDDDPDGSESILAMFDGDPATYQAFAHDYFEVDLPLEAIEHVYDHRPLSEDVVHVLNPEVPLDSIKAEALEIGYP